MNLTHTRLQALDWLLRATRAWLLQGQDTPQGLPHRDDVDWKTVGDLAYVHNLEPLLFWTISTQDTDADVPRWLWDKWEQAYFETFLKNEQRLHTLDVLTGGCKQAGVPVIVLKGPALIGRIYKDPALRPMSDLDMLCAERDLGRVVDTARNLGYKTGAVGDDPASTQHVAMYHADTGFLLEFHFRPYDVIKNHALFMDMAWDGREWIDVHDISCPALSLEMEFLFDLAHLAHHQFDVSLKHLIDIAGLLVFCREQFNWDELEVRLREFGLERVCELTKGFVAHMLHLPLPPHLPGAKNGDAAQRAFDSALRDLLALLDQPRLMDTRWVIRGFGAALRHQKGFRQKLVFLKNRILPFLDETASHCTIVRRGDIFRYYAKRICFYLRRFLLTLAHLPGLPRGNPSSLAAKRADAKNRVSGQLTL